MGLLDAFLREPAKSNIHIASRGDTLQGVGTAQDPLNGSTRRYPALRISLQLTSHASNREGEVTILSGNHN